MLRSLNWIDPYGGQVGTESWGLVRIGYMIASFVGAKASWFMWLGYKPCPVQGKATGTQ